MQRIRTAGEMGVEFSVFAEQSFIYQEIGEEARRLYRLGMRYREIGRTLGIDGKTAKKAIRRTKNEALTKVFLNNSLKFE